MDEQDFLNALDPKNWKETSTLHTPSLQAVFEDEKPDEVRITLPDSQFTLEKMEALALARFLLKNIYRLPTITCLCGSTSEHESFKLANLKETLDGKIVLSVGIDTKSDEDLLAVGEITETDKERLDTLHLRKIDLADEILVVSKRIGNSTRKEIEYAEKQNKLVRYVYRENDPFENFKGQPVDTEHEE